MLRGAHAKRIRALGGVQRPRARMLHARAHACAHVCAMHVHRLTACNMRVRGRCTPPIALIIFACAPLSIIGQHAKGIGAIEGVERPRARMFLIFERFMPTFGVKCRPFDSTSLRGDRQQREWGPQSFNPRSAEQEPAKLIIPLHALWPAPRQLSPM